MDAALLYVSRDRDTCPEVPALDTAESGFNGAWHGSCNAPCMDIPRTKLKSRRGNPWWWLVPPAVLLTVVFVTLEQHRAPLAVEREKLLVAVVERGPLSVRVRGQGTLAPRDMRWVSSTVEGQAQRVLVKPGAVVSVGELIVELSNPLLRQRADEKRWELAALEAEHRSVAAADQSELLDSKATVLRARLDFEASELKLKAEQKLIESGGGAVSRLDFERTQLETRQLQQNWEIEIERLAVMRDTVAARNAAREASAQQMRHALSRLEEQVASLEVRAPVAGVVQEVVMQAGQRAEMGGNIARIANQEDLLAELQIPEQQVRDAQPGQAAIVDTRNSQIRGRVTRVAPAVINGHVQVDIELEGPLPDDARPDLAVDGEILVAQFDETLFVRRPAMAQTRQKTTVYQLIGEGRNARRVPVTFGRASVREIQILDGLGHGDRIIISDTSQFERFERIEISG